MAKYVWKISSNSGINNILYFIKGNGIPVKKKFIKSI